jgi:dipeptidyl aminopeptidase/acylaminoacyl peptidase
VRPRPALIALLVTLVAMRGRGATREIGLRQAAAERARRAACAFAAEPVREPDGDRILLVSWVRYPPIAQVAEPFLRLAGVRVEPRTRRKHDTPGGYGIAPCAQTLTLVDVATSRETPVTLPPDGCVDGVAWAADGRRFAFRNTSKDAVEPWICDASKPARPGASATRG